MTIREPLRRWAAAGAAATIMTAASLALTAEAFAQQTVTVRVVTPSGSQTYTAPWTPNMSYLNALEQALPSVPNFGSFSLNYYPQYAGYFISAIGGIPPAGTSNYWSLCLLPAGPGTTVFALPIAPNKILLGAGDTVALFYNASCPQSLPPP